MEDYEDDYKLDLNTIPDVDWDFEDDDADAHWVDDLEEEYF